MDKVNKQIRIVTSVGGALLELQELVEVCCRQTIPEDLWEENDEMHLTINEDIAQRFLKDFDHNQLLTKLRKAHSLLSEAEFKLLSYRLGGQI